MVEPGAKEGRTGNCQHPGPDNAPRNAPTNRGKPPRGADANDGAGDRVRGADGNAEMRGTEL